MFVLISPDHAFFSLSLFSVCVRSGARKGEEKRNRGKNNNSSRTRWMVKEDPEDVSPSRPREKLAASSYSRSSFSCSRSGHQIRQPFNGIPISIGRGKSIPIPSYSLPVLPMQLLGYSVSYHPNHTSHEQCTEDNTNSFNKRIAFFWSSALWFPSARAHEKQPMLVVVKEPTSVL